MIDETIIAGLERLLFNYSGESRPKRPPFVSGRQSVAGLSIAAMPEETLSGPVRCRPGWPRVAPSVTKCKRGVGWVLDRPLAGLSNVTAPVTSTYTRYHSWPMVSVCQGWFHQYHLQNSVLLSRLSRPIISISPVRFFSFSTQCFHSYVLILIPFNSRQNILDRDRVRLACILIPLVAYPPPIQPAPPPPKLSMITDQLFPLSFTVLSDRLYHLRQDQNRHRYRLFAVNSTPHPLLTPPPSRS